MADLTVTREKMRSWYWCEQKSRENLVGMFRPELLKIVEGASCCELIPFGVRRRLRRDDILKKTGNKYTVTAQGIEMISKEV